MPAPVRRVVDACRAARHARRRQPARGRDARGARGNRRRRAPLGHTLHLRRAALSAQHRRRSRKAPAVCRAHAAGRRRKGRHRRGRHVRRGPQGALPPVPLARRGRQGAPVGQVVHAAGPKARPAAVDGQEGARAEAAGHRGRRAALAAQPPVRLPVHGGPARAGHAGGDAEGRGRPPDQAAPHRGADGIGQDPHGRRDARRVAQRRQAVGERAAGRLEVHRMGGADRGAVRAGGGQLSGGLRGARQEGHDAAPAPVLGAGRKPAVHGNERPARRAGRHRGHDAVARQGSQERSRPARPPRRADVVHRRRRGAPLDGKVLLGRAAQDALQLGQPQEGDIRARHSADRADGHAVPRHGGCRGKEPAQEAVRRCRLPRHPVLRRRRRGRQERAPARADRLPAVGVRRRPRPHPRGAVVRPRRVHTRRRIPVDDREDEAVHRDVPQPGRGRRRARGPAHRRAKERRRAARRPRRVQDNPDRDGQRGGHGQRVGLPADQGQARRLQRRRGRGGRGEAKAPLPQADQEEDTVRRLPQGAPV